MYEVLLQTFTPKLISKLTMTAEALTCYSHHDIPVVYLTVLTAVEHESVSYVLSPRQRMLLYFTDIIMTARVYLVFC